MSGPQGDKKSVFAANPAVQQEYGKVFDYMESKIPGYKAILVYSDRENRIRAEHKASTPGQMRAMLKEMYPDQPIDTLFGTDADMDIARQALDKAIEQNVDNKTGEVSPAVTTFRTGNDQAPVRAAFMTLPEKFEMTPESLVPTVMPGNFAAVQAEDDKLDAQRKNDTKAVVIRHEVAHLEEEAQKGEAMFDYDPAKVHDGGSQEGEVYADRTAIEDIPNMVKAGLIKDPDIGKQFVAARKVESFNDMIQKGEIWTTGGDSEHPGRVVRKNNIDLHATGFSIESGDTIEQQSARLKKAGAELADVRTATLGNMLEEARDGQSAPQGNAVYNRVTSQIKADENFDRDVRTGSHRDLRGMTVEPPEAERLLFNKGVVRNPNTIRGMAEDIQKTPSVSADTRAMAGDYAAAYDYLVKGKGLDTSVKAAPTPAAEAAPVTTPATSAPAVTAPPATTVQKPAVVTLGM